MATHPFILSRSKTESEMRKIVDCEFRAFTNALVRDIFMGADTPEGRAHLVQQYLSSSRKDPGDFWIKVEEKSTGRIVGACNWKVYPGSTPVHTERLDCERFKDDAEKMAKAKKIIGDMIETRVRLFTEPYLHLHICFTDPDYQRRGIGAMMLKWGCDLADQMFLPAWVEASPMGNHLYKVFGFQNVEVNQEKDFEGSTMKREPSITSFEGGKLV